MAAWLQFLIALAALLARPSWPWSQAAINRRNMRSRPPSPWRDRRRTTSLRSPS